jgi:hypothetical protein
MANENRGEVAIELGGESFTLRPTFDALSNMETRTGLGVIELAQRCTPTDYGGSWKFTTRDVHAVLIEAIKASGAKPPADLGARIIQYGLPKAAAMCGTFLINALAGGQQGNAEPTKE